MTLHVLCLNIARNPALRYEREEEFIALKNLAIDDHTALFRRLDNFSV